MSAEKVVIGVVAGLAVGAILGVLFAPEKGSDLRQKIASKSIDTVNGLKLKVSNAMEQIADKFYEDEKLVLKNHKVV